jgi:hypothetical protein
MAFGVGAGLLSGMFGLGGGIIIIPGLMFALKMDQRLAHGTSLGGVFLISCASFVTYWTHDEIDWRVVLWLSIGSVSGSLIGAKLLSIVSKKTLTVSFIAVLVIAGVRMFFEIDASGVMIIDPRCSRCPCGHVGHWRRPDDCPNFGGAVPRFASTGKRNLTCCGDTNSIYGNTAELSE